MLRTTVLTALVCGIGSLSAQHLENLNSDRPGLTRSPFTVGGKTFQIEAGYDFLYSKYQFTETN